MRQLTDKVIVITGAGSGIGLELAKCCASYGAKLALNDWNEETLQNVLQSLQASGADCIGSAFDVSDRSAMEHFAAKIWDKYGRIDVVINNAGVAMFAQSALEADFSIYQNLAQVNMWGVLHGAQVFLPYLERGNQGTLVNISSLFGLIGFAYQAPYVMTKFAVRGLTETLRQEYAHSNITICCVHPGGIKTNLIHNIDHEDQYQKSHLAGLFDKVAVTTAEKAAAKIVRGIRRGKRRIIVGPDARLMDIMSRLFPSFYHRFMPKTFDPKRFKTKSQPMANQSAKVDV